MTVCFENGERSQLCLWHINPRESVSVSLFCLSSAAFCDSITDSVKKFRTFKVHSTKLIALHGIMAAYHQLACWASSSLPRQPIRTQDSLHSAHWRCQLHNNCLYPRLRLLTEQRVKNTCDQSAKTDAKFWEKYLSIRRMHKQRFFLLLLLLLLLFFFLEKRENGPNTLLITITFENFVNVLIKPHHTLREM